MATDSKSMFSENELQEASLRRGRLKHELYALVHDLSQEMGVELDFGKNPKLSGHALLAKMIREGRYYKSLEPIVDRIRKLMRLLGEDWLGKSYSPSPAPR